MELTKKRASAEQFETMLLELEKSPLMMTMRAGSSVQYGELWQALANRLNSIGVGKTAAKWRQAWRDLKSNTKKKASKILEEKAKASESKPLTDLEVRVLNLVDTDLADGAKPPEIDISNIADLDPLSSEERSHGSGSDEEPFLYTPDLVTIYSAGDDAGGEGDSVTVKTEEESPPHKKVKSKHRMREPKRHRIEFRQTLFGAERLRKDTSELLQRLASLEESRQTSEVKSNSVLERIARALEDNTAAMNRHSAAADKQACALERLTAAIETRYVYGSGDD